MKFTALLLGSLVSTTLSVTAAPTKQDFAHSVGLRENWKTLTEDVVFPVTWTQDGTYITYRKTVEGGFAYYKENVQTGEAVLAFDQNAIANALTIATGETTHANTLPFDQFYLTDSQISFSFHYEPWQCALDGSECHAIEYSGRPKADGVVRDLRVDVSQTKIPSPDEKYTVVQSGYNIAIKNDGKTVISTNDGTKDNFYDIESVSWSPDSQALVVVKVEPGEQRYVTRVLSSPDDQLQPKVITQLYPKPGDRVDHDQPILIDVATHKTTIIDESLFSEAYMLTQFYWREDSQSFAFHYTQRGHQDERLIAVDRSTASTKVVIDEQAETFVYQWYGFFHDVQNKGEEIIWRSERDGWAHLYLIDGKSGKVKQQITKGEWPVRRVLHVDDSKRQIYFVASGMNQSEDPYFEHVYRVNFDGSKLTELTPEHASHQVSFSPDMRYYVDVYSRVDLPNVAKLRDTTTGEPIRTIATGKMDKLQQAGYVPPTPFVAKGRDGKTDIWGLIVKPIDFDPTKSYPVIENIYAGPHDSFVPKTFWPFGYHSGGDKVVGMQALANLGFIVVQMDGMGTANRSKAFHDVAWKNLGDSGFPDRILWHQAAAKQFSWYNIADGVGIYGASAGGQSTLGALLFHPDFYTVGVAFAGCYDNRMDKMSWNEQWMGYPVDQSYIDASGMEHAANLQGNLLIINGEQDSNVDPASSMQVVNALIKANKTFDLLIVPGGEHSTGRSTGPIDYIQRKQFAFFVEHLLKQPVPNWNN